MDDPHEFIAGELCLDFANALNDLFADDSRADPERYRDLLAWSKRAGSLPPRTLESLGRGVRTRSRDLSATLTRGRELAETLRRVFGSIAGGRKPARRDLDRLNEEISQALRMLRVTQGPDGMTWRWGEAPGRLDPVLWPIARSAATLLTSERAQRVRLCAFDSCRWLFVDTSKSGRRRWCDMKVCGNRTKVQKFRARTRQPKAARG